MSQRPIAGPDRFVSPRQAIWTLLACAAILAGGVAAWSNSFNGPFIFDDIYAIRDNPTLRHFPAWANFVPPHASPISRRPVVNLTFALNYAIGGLDVRGFHAWNLLIHLLAALLLFGIVRRTLNGLARDHGRWTMVHGPSSIVAVSFAVALIWAVHPLLTESVTYLTQRAESLMGLFFLLTLYCAIRGASGGHPWRWQSAAIAACALGMGAKEVMATAPIVILLYDRCFLSGSFHEAFRRRLPFYLGLAATWAILGALLIAYPWGGATGAGFGLAAVGPWEYARTQPGVILNYLRLSLWPSSLCLDYGWPIATSAGQIIPAAAVIAALLAGTLRALRRAPALGFLGAWFFLILAPTSSFMPIGDAAFEHRTYLPLAGIVTTCVVAAYWLGEQLVRRMPVSPEARKLIGRAAAGAAVLSVAGVLGWLTFDRNTDYRDAISIWQDTVNKRPRNARALCSLGCAYSSTGQVAPAFPYFNEAIELTPGYAEAYINRGIAFMKINRLSEADRDLTQAIELNPANANPYVNRAAVRLSAGRFNEALADCDKAITLRPDYAEAYSNRGIALMEINRLSEAARDITKAIELDPAYANPYNTRAAVRLSAGRFNEALADCDKAIALQPGYADAYLNRASAWYMMKEYGKALSDLKTCEQLGGRPPPEFVEALLRAAGRAE